MFVCLFVYLCLYVCYRVLGLIHSNHGEKVIDYLSQELRSNSSEVGVALLPYTIPYAKLKFSFGVCVFYYYTSDVLQHKWRASQCAQAIHIR